VRSTLQTVGAAFSGWYFFPKSLQSNSVSFI
jgi:hypothetical protein